MLTILRSALATGALSCLALLAGCAGTFEGGAPGPAVDAPAWRSGDRWVYRGSEGFRQPLTWQETHTVTAAAPDRATVVVDYDGQVHGSRTELWGRPGDLLQGALMDIETRRFATPVREFDFPLAQGRSWNQWVENVNEATGRRGQINRYVSVGGWDRVTTPAGTFDAIRMRVLLQLDDDEFWRDRTHCNYLIWYAPAVGAPVREEKDAYYLEKGNKMDTEAVRAQHTVIELVSFTRGG
jgi:hypothetical protein